MIYIIHLKSDKTFNQRIELLNTFIFRLQIHQRTVVPFLDYWTNHQYWFNNYLNTQVTKIPMKIKNCVQITCHKVGCERGIFSKKKNIVYSSCTSCVICLLFGLIYYLLVLHRLSSLCSSSRKNLEIGEATKRSTHLPKNLAKNRDKLAHLDFQLIQRGEPFEMPVHRFTLNKSTILCSQWLWIFKNITMKFMKSYFWCFQLSIKFYWSTPGVPYVSAPFYGKIEHVLRGDEEAKFVHVAHDMGCADIVV